MVSKSYLCNREFQVQGGMVLSNCCAHWLVFPPVAFSLGPLLLFIIYVNDLISSLKVLCICKNDLVIFVASQARTRRKLEDKKQNSTIGHPQME
jgi:hypothetical protein